MFSFMHVATVFWMIALFSEGGSAYELQDTIHTLKEENLHLQHRLENLTRALRDLKHLIEHSKAAGEEHDPEYLHAWKEWSQHGISAETHHMLEQALCFTEPHDAAEHTFITPVLFLLSPVVFMAMLS